MRFAFLDEGGIAQQEPYVVVAGVLVHADDEVIPLESELEALVRKHIPETDQEGFVFHAADIWGGGKYFKNRDEWPWEKRAAILDDLVLIPEKLQIPVIYSYLAKEAQRPEIEPEMIAKGNARPFDYEIAYHSIAFANCFLRVEQMMRKIWPDEIAQVVAEDNADARKTIKGVVQILRTPSRLQKLGLDRADVLPLERIRGSVQFAEKTESRPLQLADACAFLIRRRHYKHNERSARFYDKLKEWMLYLPKDDTSPPDPIQTPKTTWPFGPLLWRRQA